MMSTRRRPRTRLWSWSPSRRRRRGPRTSARPSHADPRRVAPGAAGCSPLLLVPVVLVLLLVIAWAVDSSSGDVARNVQLAGIDIGGLSEDELTGRVEDVAADYDDDARRAGRRRRRVRDHRRATSVSWSTRRPRPRARSRSATARSCSPGRSSWALSLVSERAGAAPVPGERRAGRRAGDRARGRRAHAAHRADRRAGRRRVRGGARRRRRRARHRRHRAAAPRRRGGGRRRGAGHRPARARDRPDPAGRLARRRPRTPPTPPRRSSSEPVEIRTSGGNRTITLRPAPLLGAADAATPTAPWSSPSTRPRPPPPCGEPSPTSRATPSTPASRSRAACRSSEATSPARSAAPPGSAAKILAALQAGTRTVDARAHRRPGVVHGGRRRGVRDQGAGGRQLRVAQRRPHHRRSRLHHLPRPHRRPDHQHPPHGRPRPRRRHRPGRELLDQRPRGRAHRREGLRAGGGHPRRQARRGGRRRRVAVRHHHVQRRLLRRAPDRRVAGALRVLRPLSPRARGHHGVPGPRPALHQRHALRDHDLDLVHGQQPHHHAVLHALRPRRADGDHRVAGRAAARWSPPPARSPTRTAPRSRTSSARPTGPARASAASTATRSDDDAHR